MLGKSKTILPQATPDKLEAMAREVESLKNSRNHLKGEVIRMKAEIENLQRKLDTTFQFFEIRVDQIYRNLGEGGTIDAGASEAAAALHLPTNPDWEKLIFAARSTFLEPGLIPSPITLSGMRIDTRFATEKLHYTEITGGLSEIAVFGPYRRLHVGQYRLELALEPLELSGQMSLYLEVFTVKGGKEIEVAGRKIENAQDTRLTFGWNLDMVDNEVQFRIHQRMGDAVRLYGIDLGRA